MTELGDLRAYATVQRWLDTSRTVGFRPVPDDPERKLAVLGGFLEHIGVDPDTLIATSTDLVPDGATVRNRHLKQLKLWVTTLGLSPVEQTKAENVVRGFFIKNAVKVMTRPYADVYHRPGPAASARRG